MEMLQNRPSAAQYGSMTGDKLFSVTKDDIQGEYDISIVAGSTVPLNKENRMSMMEEIVKFLTAIGIAPGSQASRELGRIMFKEMNMPMVDKIFDTAEEEILAQANQVQQGQQQGQVGGPQMNVVPPSDIQPGGNQLLEQELANQIMQQGGGGG